MNGLNYRNETAVKDKVRRPIKYIEKVIENSKIVAIEP